jgi:acetyl-CoA synthetase
MTSTLATTAFRAARDQLLDLRTDGDRAAAEFVWPDVGDHFNWAVDWFDVIAEENDAVALWIVEEDGSEQKVTFAEMARRSDQVANWLVTLGVGRGDHVLLMLGNQVELWEAMLAIMKIGAVILPTSTLLGSADLADRVERAGVRHVIVGHDDAAKFDDVPGEYTRIAVGAASSDGRWTSFADSRGAATGKPGVVVDTSDASIVYFTSGTTSKPKMVVHTHSSYPVGHLTTTYWLGVQKNDVHLAISSPGWGKHAWSCFFAPWIAEATVFVYNYAKFDAAALRHQLERAKVTTFCAPPTVWRMLIQSALGDRPAGLREILSAGEPLNPEVISQVQRAWGLVIRDGYGQTETTAIIANAPGSQLKAGSMGLPLPGVHIALVDPLTGEKADEGEVCLDLSSPAVNLMAGYYGDPQRSADVVRDGYFHTGDVASRDENGYITFIGRTDDTRLNIAKAYVVLAAGWEATEETALEVLRHARVSLPPFMRVRRLEFFDLPKTISGKIRRVELRNRENDAAAAGVRLPDEWRDDQFPQLKGR